VFRRKEKLFFSFLFLALFFFACCRLFFLRKTALDSISSYLLAPFLIVNNYTIEPVRNKIKDIKRLCTISGKYDDMEKLYEDLRQQYIEQISTNYYFDQVKELVDFKKRYNNENAVLAKVIFRLISNERQEILINKGENASVKKDMVAVYKNCLLGRVVEIFPYYSRVVLITDKKSNVASCCQKTKAEGICQGQNETDKLLLLYVNHLSTLKKDDYVLSSGQGLIFPQGFALGRIDSFEKQGLCYLIELKPLIDVSKVDSCFVLQKGEY
jgi:rod shape-determining protein MreC